jgi:hypothetical protein
MAKTSKYYKKKNHNKSRKYNKKGGFFSFFTGKKSQNTVVPTNQPSWQSPVNEFRGSTATNYSKGLSCDPTNIGQLTTSDQLHAKYQQCCPKRFGFKNSSNYCKQIESNWLQALKRENDAKGYYGEETDPEQRELDMNLPVQGESQKCDAVNLDNINSPETLKPLYTKCCPKQFGFKNRSSFCKKLDSKINSPLGNVVSTYPSVKGGKKSRRNKKRSLRRK